MLTRNKFAVILVCLLLIPITAPLSCKNKEKPAEANPQKLNFYTGREVEPIHTRSYIKKPHSTYVFEPALQGDIVRHDFLIENDARRALELSNAEGCCGAFVESYTQVIPPGQTGKISVLLLTDSRGGQDIDGTIRAATNDEDRPEITIDISMHVKEFAALHPYRIWLKGSPEDEIVEKCIVVPNKHYPFSITGIKTRKGVWFDYSYREIEKNGRKAYEITVRNTRNKPGPYQDVLFVQTDSPVRPEFKIRIEGRIRS